MTKPDLMQKMLIIDLSKEPTTLQMDVKKWAEHGWTIIFTNGTNKRSNS